ncbi:MAG: LapA family protein [Candidatus Zixiibacteriota bacterium]
MWAVRAIVVFALIALIVGFVVYNSVLDQRVAVNLYWKQFENVRLLYVIFWSFLSGFAFAFVLAAGAYVKNLTQINSARRTIKGLQEEVSALRNRPIEESRDMFGDDEKQKLTPQQQEAD